MSWNFVSTQFECLIASHTKNAIFKMNINSFNDFQE